MTIPNLSLKTSIKISLTPLARSRVNFGTLIWSGRNGFLKESLRHILSLFISTEENNYIKEIAKVHNRDNLDIWPVLYDLWLESLIETVQKYDEKFDEDIELSWRMVMSIGITYMKFKYDHS